MEGYLSKETIQRIEQYQQLAKNAKYLVLKTSPKRYAVIKLTTSSKATVVGAPPGKMQCVPEFEIVEEKLNYEDACRRAVELNSEEGINVLYDPQS